jgi:hypothetical protein
MHNGGAEAVDPLFVDHDLGESSGLPSLPLFTGTGQACCREM